MKKEEVREFLTEFQQKMRVWDILFISDRREKNTRALLELEISSNDRKKVIEEIDVEDYSEGPIEDKIYNSSDLWVFGKTVKGKEVYIKISMGKSSFSGVICISFHLSEYRMEYPFKDQ